MPGYMTDDEAKEYHCPIARTFPDGKRATCDGSKCILWRMKPVSTDDPYFISAAQREMACMSLELSDGKNPMKYHKQAVAKVSADLEGYGIKSVRGVCGLGGKP